MGSNGHAPLSWLPVLLECSRMAQHYQPRCRPWLSRAGPYEKGPKSGALCACWGSPWTEPGTKGTRVCSPSRGRTVLWGPSMAGNQGQIEMHEQGARSLPVGSQGPSCSGKSGLIIIPLGLERKAPRHRGLGETAPMTTCSRPPSSSSVQQLPWREQGLGAVFPSS